MALANWNGMQFVGRCMDGIRAQSVQLSDIVIVDNGSTDGSREWIRQHNDDVTLLENDRNEGVAAGYNRAIAACQTEFVLILNTDVFLDPNFVSAALEAMVARPDVAAVTGRLYQEGTAEFVSGGFFLRRQIRINYEGITDTAQEVFGATGAAVLYRRAVLDELRIDGQYFDENYFAYGEDIDLSWRTQLMGWRILYEPSATAHHVGSGSLEGRLRFIDKPAVFQRHTLKNRYLTVLKNASPTALLRLLPWLLLTEFLLWPFLLLRKPWRVPYLLLAFADVARLLPATLRKRAQVQARRRVPTNHLRQFLRGF